MKISNKMMWFSATGEAAKNTAEACDTRRDAIRGHKADRIIIDDLEVDKAAIEKAMQESTLSPGEPTPYTLTSAELNRVTMMALMEARSSEQTYKLADGLACQADLKVIMDQDNQLADKLRAMQAAKTTEVIVSFSNQGPKPDDKKLTIKVGDIWLSAAQSRAFYFSMLSFEGRMLPVIQEDLNAANKKIVEAITRAQS